MKCLVVFDKLTSEQKKLILTEHENVVIHDSKVNVDEKSFDSCELYVIELHLKDGILKKRLSSEELLFFRQYRKRFKDIEYEGPDKYLSLTTPAVSAPTPAVSTPEVSILASPLNKILEKLESLEASASFSIRAKKDYATYSVVIENKCVKVVGKFVESEFPFHDAKQRVFAIRQAQKTVNTLNDDTRGVGVV